jgi:hypothetical protein
MADEQPKKTHPATPVITLYIAFLIITLLTGVFAGFQEKLGIDLGSIFSGEVSILPFGQGISLGDEVVIRNTTLVFSQPDDSSSFSSVSQGMIGKVIDGPIEADGVTWWKIRFKDGTEGWVKADDLAGIEVVTNSETQVYAEPGDTRAIFSVPKGVVGKIIDGPITIGGEVWWKVQFEDGSAGWVKESSLGALGNDLAGGFSKFISIVKVVATYVSLILLTLLIYAYVRLKQVKAGEDKKYANHYEPDEEEITTNERWQKINRLTDSENPNDWKQAIIDADVILDELLTARGFQGDGLGEKLQSVRSSDLSTINSAWDAHKIRNKIAHDGGDFVLTQREAKRVLNLFTAVFREFGFI